MISVGIRDLKNNLSHYLRRVQAGELVVVTDRGRPVAELCQPQRADLDEPHMRKYRQMVEAGEIRLGSGGNPFGKLSAAGIVRLPPGTVDAWLEDSRKDKWP